MNKELEKNLAGILRIQLQAEYLVHKQTVQHWMVKSRASINAAQLLMLHTAREK